MSLFDNLAESLADRLTDFLTAEQKTRATALIIVRSIMPDADVFDRIRLTRYILTDSEDEPTPPEQSGYPHPSGDVTVLGPEIFASTPDPRTETVLNWKGVNFARMTEAEAQHPDDPGPEAPSGELPDFDPAEPAPMAGTHWQGRRGGQTG